MTEKRFVPIFDGFDKRVVGAKDNGVIISFMDMFDLLNELHKENEQLKSENNILKITIARNEAYIERITHKGEWSNTSDEEKEVIAYLQAYHQGDVKEIRK